jgi:ubiquinone/menaquinone biosynthesis C-methylase UbiE
MFLADHNISDFSSDFKLYHKVVLGSERSRHTYARRLNTIDELCESLRGKRVLDLGCGYGFRTMGIAKKGAEHVIGIDQDTARIREGQSFAEKSQIKNVRFAVMDAVRTEFNDESFDVVVADEMIHHVDNVDKVLKEMIRVTRKGGRIIISDHNKWSIMSEMVRLARFGKERAKLFSPKEIAYLFDELSLRDIVYKYIIFTIPFSATPDIILRLNYRIENIIEHLPLLRAQCGVYVVRGIK